MRHESIILLRGLLVKGDKENSCWPNLSADMQTRVKNELLSAVLGGIFFLEAVSVVVQVTSFKLTGRRIFLMAPIHHHYEKKGWAEPTIVIRFWIISMILALCGLATLKIR